jgi:hypothetical protein
MKSFLDYCWNGFVPEDDKATAYPLPGKLAEGCYDKGKLVPAVGVKPAKGWRVEPNWIPSDKSGTRPYFADVPMLVAEAPGGILNYSFEGNVVGIAIAAGLDAGIIEYQIDKGLWQKQDLFTAWSAQLYLPWFYTQAYGLQPGKHLLNLRILAEKNPQSKGTACRIRYFFVNQ